MMLSVITCLDLHLSEGNKALERACVHISFLVDTAMELTCENSKANNDPRMVLPGKIINLLLFFFEQAFRQYSSAIGKTNDLTLVIGMNLFKTGAQYFQVIDPSTISVPIIRHFNSLYLILFSILEERLTTKPDSDTGIDDTFFCYTFLQKLLIL